MWSGKRLGKRAPEEHRSRTPKVVAIGCQGNSTEAMQTLSASSMTADHEECTTPAPIPWKPNKRPRPTQRHAHKRPASIGGDDCHKRLRPATTQTFSSMLAEQRQATSEREEYTFSATTQLITNHSSTNRITGSNHESLCNESEEWLRRHFGQALNAQMANTVRAINHAMCSNITSPTHGSSLQLESNQLDCTSISSVHSSWSDSSDTVENEDTDMRLEIGDLNTLPNELQQCEAYRRLTAKDATELGNCVTPHQEEMILNLMVPCEIHTADFMEAET